MLGSVGLPTCARYEVNSRALGQLYDKLQVALEAIAAILHNAATTVLLVEQHILLGRLQGFTIVKPDILLAGIRIKPHISQGGHADLGLQLALKIRWRWAVEVLEIEGHMLVGQSSAQKVGGNSAQNWMRKQRKISLSDELR